MVQYIETKSILSKLRGKDSYFGITYNMNLYRGCQHACILPMFGVTLRKGSREYFYKDLNNNFPSIREKYQSRFGEQYECFSPNYRMLTDTFRKLSAKLGIDTRMQFYHPKIYKQQSIF